MPSASALQPISPASMPDAEKEKEAPWIMRKLAGSMTGRIIMSGYESLRATGTSVICLSPWGDSSPLLLPCIRFRDLAVHMVIVATGGTAAIAAPVMGSVGDAIVTTLGDSIMVELGLHAGFDLTVKATDDLLIEHPLHHILPSNDRRLVTTAVKSLTITLKYKYTVTDAALGFFRSSVHRDNSLFSDVKDYLSIEKGWFSPYLFASGRRPIIPRTMTPDVVFCHGPFLAGDYNIGETLLTESATVIALCASPPPKPAATPSSSRSQSHLHLPSFSELKEKATAKFSRSRSPSPAPPSSDSGGEIKSAEPSPSLIDPAVPAVVPVPRRMVLVVLGIKPHRKLWTTSARPSESVIEYILLNGCPAVVVPVKPGSPLVAWDTLTLEQLHKIGAKVPGGVESDKAKGIAHVLLEYLALCVDWERLTEPTRDTDEEKAKVAEEGQLEAIDAQSGDAEEQADIQATQGKKAVLREAIRLLVTGAINSWQSKEVRDKMDLERAGIVMFRIP